MAIGLRIKIDARGIEPLKPRAFEAAAVRALRKAGATALRDMRSEASKRIRARKAIKAKFIREALTLRKPTGKTIATMSWAVDVSGRPIRVSDYSYRGSKKRGVSVQINRGTRSILPHAFVAVMSTGHKGVFKRQATSRLPIRELFASRPVDALLHQGEADAVAERGRASLVGGFTRLLPIELAKGGA